MSQRRVSLQRACFALAVAVSLAGCGLLPSASVTRTPVVSLELKENGFLIDLPGNDRHPQVEALVTQEHWVIVTIVDPLFDLEPFDRFTSPHVDSVEVTRFTSAVQVALRFSDHVGEAYVVSSPSDPFIRISVFRR